MLLAESTRLLSLNPQLLRIEDDRLKLIRTNKLTLGSVLFRAANTEIVVSSELKDQTNHNDEICSRPLRSLSCRALIQPTESGDLFMLQTLSRKTNVM